MISKMTIGDYEAVYDLCINTPNMGLCSFDDSREGIELFLKPNHEIYFAALDGEAVNDAIIS